MVYHRPTPKAAITALAHFVPDRVLSNHDLEQMVETSDEWIVERVGIKERRIAPKDKPTSWLAAEACKRLIKKHNVDPAIIDCVIVATVTPDMFFPNTSNLIANQIGAVNAWTYDMLSACSGFVYALAQGAMMIESGRYDNVLVVGADKMSGITDYTDRNTCILFGDAAGAVLLQPVKQDDKEGGGIHDFVLKTKTDDENALYMKAGGSAFPTSLETIANKQHYLYQNGKIVFKKAIFYMVEVISEILERNNLSVDDIAWICPHQANRRILQNVAKLIGVDDKKMMITIHKYGNTTASTIPVCLSEYASQIKKGDRIILASFGAGLTWGSTLLTWSI